MGRAAAGCADLDPMDTSESKRESLPGVSQAGRMLVCGGKTPRWPHTRIVIAVMESVPYSDVLTHSSSHCPYSKFDPYLFDPENLYQHKKNKAFESWGYSVEDSRWLQNEIAKQGLEKYRTGEYALGFLNEQGQRISIRVEIPRKDREGTVSFITGWMVYPNGEIRLNTPYGGK